MEIEKRMLNTLRMYRFRVSNRKHLTRVPLLHVALFNKAIFGVRFYVTKNVLIMVPFRIEVLIYTVH